MKQEVYYMRYSFEAVLSPEGEFYNVSFPDIPECNTYGEGIKDAMEMAADALETMLLAKNDLSKPIPTPTFGSKVPSGGFIAIVSVEPNPAHEPDFVTTKEAGDILGVSDARIRAMIRDGIIPSVKKDAGHLIPIDALKRRLSLPRKAGRPKKELQTA
jgi:predicted RNase H-like HicB family nuclease